jgi:hypothetical protein
VFTPSIDHETVLPDGQPAIIYYEFELYQEGVSEPVQNLNLGKPAPDADGFIRVDVGQALALEPGFTYASRVIAVGPEGQSASRVSTPFSTVDCTSSAAPSDGAAGTDTSDPASERDGACESQGNGADSGAPGNRNR